MNLKCHIISISIKVDCSIINPNLWESLASSRKWEWDIESQHLSNQFSVANDEPILWISLLRVLISRALSKKWLALLAGLCFSDKPFRDFQGCLDIIGVQTAFFQIHNCICNWPVCHSTRGSWNFLTEHPVIWGVSLLEIAAFGRTEWDVSTTESRAGAFSHSFLTVLKRPYPTWSLLHLREHRDEKETAIRW